MRNTPCFTKITLAAVLLFFLGMEPDRAILAAVPIGSFYGAWSSTVTYPKGSVVTSGGSSYISILGTASNPNVNHPPLTSSKWWSPFAAMGSQGVPGPPGPGPIGGSQVIVDSSGLIIGPYATFAGGIPGTLLKVGNQTIFIALDGNGIQGQATTTNLAFASVDCSGPPLMFSITTVKQGDLLEWGFKNMGSIYYIATGTATAQTIQSGATVGPTDNWTNLPHPFPGCQSSSGQPIVGPLAHISASVLGMPPLSLQLR
jgi:hypothetical protein